MLKKLISLLCLILLSSAAHADLWCSQSYRYESFALGMAQGFKGGESRPAILDEMCFRLGIQYGTNLKKSQERNSRCDTAFHEGMDDGLKGSIESQSPDNFNCYQAGNQLGLAKLSIYARARNAQEVGANCVRVYVSGRNDGMNSRVATLPNDEKERTCYLTGHNDGSLFGGLL